MKRKFVTATELIQKGIMSRRAIHNYMHEGRCKDSNGDIIYLKPDCYGRDKNGAKRRTMAFSYEALMNGLGAKQLRMYKDSIDKLFEEEIEEEIEEPKEKNIEEAKEVLSTKTEINEKGEIIVTIVIKIK